MTTKQEVMQMMDNHLPGEPLTVRDYGHTSSIQPPAYPVLQQQQPIYGEQHYEQPRPGPSQIYTICQPAINYTPPTQFGGRSHLAPCPLCHVTQLTRCEYRNSMMTHIVAGILLFTTCCCCVPYMFNSCKSAQHYCSNCGTYLGVKNK